MGAFLNPSLSDEGPEVIARVQQCHDAAMRLFRAASASFKEAQDDFKALARYFGEEDIDPESLFGSLLSFVRSIEVALSKTKRQDKGKSRRQDG